uniref:Anaphase-promoting complex subunit 4 WD40 domain-containing protein n=1 Tax=Aplanochytrium stocchinoi TaxID=215587 RepID=A0A7S3LM15_9STRA|mmetsp:Transcript_33980/g.41911  ORF Transcript_33980/g.41911 Transcript_33980/m.41911 type:complete len:371 (-) Transcript_33980:18-1130(-)|eukprot:CAMPEP_0204836596 /NCGR_PEP_ID=MMETSP1346-20131115/25594_1 /ASSEMBLY_ACC=CAM_ASM_000771 /TAXON_ID=215587 /ORGANISM="Aplanochytrium stocchinoi, Strain GSBS06" /LENGTH=370 /DNA_ID=CAMNT_0051971451 /DNA_START=223 /DNA_END=1335 /DNA_ORIENTATION=+
MEKRDHPEGEINAPGSENGTKRARTSVFSTTTKSSALTVADEKELKDKEETSTALVEAMRTSELQAPTMQLLGHGDAVHTMRFSPNGNNIASGGFDRRIFLWKVFGDCDNYGILTGHKNCIQEVQWSTDNARVLSASADKTVGIWDVETGNRLRKLADHNGVVNSIATARLDEHLLVSGSDDCTAKLWDPRQKSCTFSFDHEYQVFSVRLNSVGTTMYSAGLDGLIRVWDVKKPLDPIIVLKGHSDLVTGIDIDSSDSFVASIGMDNQVRIWDVKPFVEGGDDNRCTRILEGSVQNFEKLLLRCSWSRDGRKVAAGSADSTACAWDVASSKLLYKLPGHKGPVREVVFHPNQPILGSCSSDRTILIGEIE